MFCSSVLRKWRQRDVINTVDFLQVLSGQQVAKVKKLLRQRIYVQLTRWLILLGTLCQTWFKVKQLTLNCHSNNRFVFVATLQNTWSGSKFENFIMSWHLLYSNVQHWHWTPMQSSAESGVSDHVRSWNFGKVNLQAFYWLTVKNTVLSLVDTDAFDC